MACGSQLSVTHKSAVFDHRFETMVKKETKKPQTADCLIARDPRSTHALAEGDSLQCLVLWAKDRCVLSAEAPVVPFFGRGSSKLTKQADILAFLPQKQDFWRRYWLRGNPLAPCKPSDDTSKCQIKDFTQQDRDFFLFAQLFFQSLCLFVPFGLL